MTDEEAIKNIKQLLKWYLKEEPLSETVYKREAVEMVIKKLEQQPCEDAISREDAIRIASINSMPVNECVRLIKELPSVTPQPKIGHWEYVQYDSDPNIGNWHCSECRGICTEMHSIEDAYNYCPNCGAKMEVEE